MATKTAKGAEELKTRLLRIDIVFGCLGIAFCLGLRDIPQFVGFATINGNPSAQYALAVSRALVLVVLLAVLVFAKRQQRAIVASATYFIMGTLAAAVLQIIGLFLLMTVKDPQTALAACVLVGCGQSLLVFQWAIWLFRRTPYEFLCIVAIAFVAAGAMEMLIAFMQSSAVTPLARTSFPG